MQRTTDAFTIVSLPSATDMTPTQLLAMLVPDSALPLVVVILGILVIVGVVARQRALSLLIMGAIMLILTPFIESAFAALPWWIAIGIFLVVGLSMARGALALMLGTRAADHAVGHVAGYAIIATARGGFRAVQWMLRLLVRRGTA